MRDRKGGATVEFAASLHGHRDHKPKHHTRSKIFWLTATVGLAGTGFQLYDVTEKPVDFPGKICSIPARSAPPASGSR